MIKRDSFVRFMCKVSFCILFIWVCLIICFTLDLVLHQFMFRLRVFKLSSRFFQPDYVKAVFYHFLSLRSFLSLCLDSLHVFVIGSLDSVFVKEKNISSLDVVIVILISLCNSALSHYVNKHLGSSLSSQNSLAFYILKLICISFILFSIYFQWFWQEEFVKQSRVLKLMIISFILATFLFYWAKLKHNRTLRYSFSIADNNSKELRVEASHQAA